MLRLLSYVSATPSGATISLFVLLSISRCGLWAFDLVVQEITQTRIMPAHRSGFAGIEMSLVSLFELLQWTLAAGFSSPEKFSVIAFASLGAICLSATMYAYWVRRQRGHLLHWKRSQCLKGRGM